MAIAPVQYDDFMDAGSDSTIANDTALNTTTGNFLKVEVNGYNAANDNALVDSIADTAGNTYVKAVEELTGGANIEEACSIWYAENITGNANNVTTITYKGDCTDRYISVTEFSGLAISSSLEDTASDISGDVTSHSSGNMTASTNDAVVIGGICTKTLVNMTAGTNFTEVTSDMTSVYHCAEYRIISSSGAYAATITTDGSTFAVICGAIFKGVAAGGVTVPVMYHHYQIAGGAG